MSTPFIGEIRMFGGYLAPLGWEFCHGQEVAIEEHDDLFRLIGTTYGGDGAKTFALPDLKRRSPMHRGRGYYNRREYPVGAVTAVDGTAETTDSSASADDAPRAAVPGRLSLNFIIATGGVYPSREWPPLADALIAEGRIFAFDFAPYGWAPCDGQLLNLYLYQPLYSLLGTAYGGDGQTTFALPDLRGGVPVHDRGRVGRLIGGATFGQGRAPAGTRREFLALNFCIALSGVFPSFS